MNLRTRRVGAWAAVCVVLLVAFAWWLDQRTRPDRVGPRLIDGLKARHPDAAVERLDGGVLQVMMPSGAAIAVRMSTLFDRCRADRLTCSGAIDGALDDVDHADASTRNADRSTLRPMITGDGAGYRYGYLTDPLVGPFEIRYALTSGLASSFVTATIADRLGLSRDALRQAALVGLRATDAQLERVPDVEPPVFRVRFAGDPPAVVLDADLMRRFATTLGARRLYLIIPARATLLLAAANDKAAAALDALQVRLRATDARTLDGGLLAYDVDAPEGRELSIASRSSVLRVPSTAP